MSAANIPGCTISYRRAGNATPALLFVHGGFCDHRDWRFQIRDLQDEFTVVAYDQRCHGRSRANYQSVTVDQLANDVHSLIDALDLGRTIVIGHSLGARVAIQAAADRPDHLSGLILVDGSRLTTGETDEDVRKIEEQRFGDDPGQYLSYRFNAMFFDNADPAVRQQVVDTAASSPPDLIRAVAGATGRWDALGLEPALAAIPHDLPTLAIQSTFGDHKTERRSLHSSDTSTPWLDRLSQHIPQLEVVITPGVGHFNMLEAAPAVTAAIRRFAHAIRS